MINRDIEGGFEELDQEQIQTIKFLEDLHPLSLAYNNIQIKKKKKKLKNLRLNKYQEGIKLFPTTVKRNQSEPMRDEQEISRGDKNCT